MQLYPSIKSIYEKNTFSITTKKTPLTPSLVAMLQEELSDKPFIQEKLQALFRQPHFITLSEASFQLHYIPIRELTQKRMKQVFHRLLVVSKVLQIKKPIQIWFLPCKVDRYFPKGEVVQPIHINGGYTYTYQDKIYVYRYEEFPKVFLHELLHNSILHLDMWKKEYLMLLYKAFDIDTTSCETSCSTRLVPNEAIVEAWAIMFHIACISIEKQIPLQILYNLEMSHNLSMSHRLWKYQQEVYPEWKEETHSYSYIRLKTCILYFWKKFEILSYPYDDITLTTFFLKYNKKPEFLKQIKKTSLPTTNTFQMTCTGNQ